MTSTCLVHGMVATGDGIPQNLGKPLQVAKLETLAKSYKECAWSMLGTKVMAGSWQGHGRVMAGSWSDIIQDAGLSTTESVTAHKTKNKKNAPERERETLDLPKDAPFFASSVFHRTNL